MNFLAHLHLSGENEEIKIGNFIGDAVKGKKYQKFALDIQKGILLHRKIDYFTDKHDITKDLSRLFNGKYGKYSGIVVDIMYDYFLANNWENYSNQQLEKFISDSYSLLMLNFSVLPLEVKKFLPFLIGKNRLLSYRNIKGIESVLTAMAKYTSLPNYPKFAIEVLQNNHQIFKENFTVFYDELYQFSRIELEKDYIVN
ncbi:MAG: ACP phosphodiesterase [Bacteroidota bacterium]